MPTFMYIYMYLCILSIENYFYQQLTIHVHVRVCTVESKVFNACYCTRTCIYMCISITVQIEVQTIYETSTCTACTTCTYVHVPFAKVHWTVHVFNVRNKMYMYCTCIHVCASKHNIYTLHY